MQNDLNKQSWMLIIAAVLGVGVSLLAVALIPLAVFLKPLNAAFGWGRAEISLAITVMGLAMAIAMPIAGWIIDRYGIVRPAIVSILGIAAGLLFMPTAITQFGLMGLYATAGWIGAVGTASSAVIYVKVLSAVFDKSRGLALGFAMAGMPLGMAVAPLIAVTLLQAYGWQAGFYGLAALPVVIGIPTVLYVGAHAPAMTTAAMAAAGGKPSSRDTSEEYRIGDAMKTRSFATMFLVFLVAAVALHGIQIHLPALLSDRGVPQHLSVAALSVMFVVALIARVVCGFLFDRFFAPWVGALCFLVSAIGVAMLILPGAPSVQVILAIVLFAVGTGAETDLLAFLVSRYYGNRAFAQIYGWLFAAFMIGSAIGPYLVGLAFDQARDYTTALAWSSAGLLLSTVLLASLPRFAKRGATAAAPATAPAE